MEVARDWLQELLGTHFPSLRLPLLPSRRCSSASLSHVSLPHPLGAYLAEKVMGKSAEKPVMSQDAPYSIGTTPNISRCWHSLGDISLLSCHSWTCKDRTVAA